MNTLPLVLLLSIAAMAQPQPVVIAIEDISAHDSPVTLSGTVTARDTGVGVLRYSLEVKASAVNRSGKDIVLLVTDESIHALSVIDVDGPTSQDYFLSPDLFRSGTSETFENKFGPFGKPTGPTDETAAAKQPRATSSTAFVQFIDGSTWGDPEKAKLAFEERRQGWNTLESLQTTYRENGERQFSNELMKESMLIAIRQLQDVYRASRNDTDTAINMMTRILERADVRSRAMRAGN